MIEICLRALIIFFCPFIEAFSPNGKKKAFYGSGAGVVIRIAAAGSWDVGCNSCGMEPADLVLAEGHWGG